MTLAKDRRDAAVAQSARAAAADGFLVLADEQTQGVGRRGRAWVSQAEDNLYFSFVFAPEAAAQADTAAFLREALKLNFAIGVATVEACAAVGVRTARVKWPNDVWVRGKKMSGMLVDVDPRSRSAIAGVGMNVNQVGLLREGRGSRASQSEQSVWDLTLEHRFTLASRTGARAGRPLRATPPPASATSLVGSCQPPARGGSGEECDLTTTLHPCRRACPSRARPRSLLQQPRGAHGQVLGRGAWLCAAVPLVLRARPPVWGDAVLQPTSTLPSARCAPNT